MSNHCHNNIITIKASETLFIVAQYCDDNDAPLTLEGLSVACDLMMLDNKVIDHMQVETTDVVNGKFVMSSTLDSLPTGKLKADILFTSTSGARIASDTFMINVVDAITMGQ